jgi:hypothetical protein
VKSPTALVMARTVGSEVTYSLSHGTDCR